MEGHLEVPNVEENLLTPIENQWKRLYFRTKDGRFQWFAVIISRFFKKYI